MYVCDTHSAGRSAARTLSLINAHVYTRRTERNVSSPRRPPDATPWQVATPTAAPELAPNEDPLKISGPMSNRTECRTGGERNAGPDQLTRPSARPVRSPTGQAQRGNPSFGETRPALPRLCLGFAFLTIDPASRFAPGAPFVRFATPARTAPHLGWRVILRLPRSLIKQHVNCYASVKV
jgi:hypothetical protein